MALLLRLEDFDADPDPNAGAQDIAALPGYDAGFAAGQAAADTAQKSIDASLVQTLEDMAFGFAEARQHILQGLVPFFDALATQLLPGIVQDVFHARVLETLQDIATTQMAGPVRMIVHPDQAAGIAALLPVVNGIDIDLQEDTDIGRHGVLISHRTGELTLDLDGLIAQLSTILASVGVHGPTPSQETQKHG